MEPRCASVIHVPALHGIYDARVVEAPVGHPADRPVGRPVGRLRVEPFVCYIPTHPIVYGIKRRRYTTFFIPHLSLSLNLSSRQKKNRKGQVAATPFIV